MAETHDPQQVLPLDLVTASGLDDRVTAAEEAPFWIERMRATLRESGRRAHDMRQACVGCGSVLGLLEVVGNQQSVSCARCGRFAYNAPKTETGERPRTVRTVRQGVKPSQQARIFERDYGRCVLCGGRNDLTIGHLLSVADGVRCGATEVELNADANLAAMCEACNLGLGSRSVSLRTFAVLMVRLLRAELERTGRQDPSK